MLCILIPWTCAAAPPTPSERLEFFEKHIRPLLADHCFSCHGPAKQRGGLRLDSRAALLKGGDVGPVVTPGHPEKSPLVAAVRHTGDVKMPPKGKLPDDAVADLTRWVEMGLPWPEGGNPATAAVQVSAPGVAEARQKHWAFRPVRRPTPPPVRAAGWPNNAVDHFILAKLEAVGLRPTPPADKRTLLRRVTFDLIGLPPTLEEIDAFLADDSPEAFVRVVDRLLASPHYGERWGRHWLDVARYADTKGYVFQEERRYPYSYTYRDYVIRAFNDDKPYDRLILEQLAADQLPDRDPSALAAMGFLTLGRRFLNNVHDIIDDRIDVVSRGLLGLTVGCARCHDHKYDPIPTRDYYSLYGVFASSVEPKDQPELGTTPEPTPQYQAFRKKLAELEKDVKDFEEANQKELAARNRAVRDKLRELQKRVDRLKVTHPGSPPRAMALADLPQPVTPAVFLRGNPNNRGPDVPRQFLEVLAGPDRKPFTKGSGRLELAQAIVNRANPLTARVFVNRVWLHHFGAGLVRTPSDFGLRGEPPTHPELLDWLASAFLDNGWSIKQLHRLILLSATYQQATAGPSAVDPDNRLLGRMNRQRLAFEPLRDALLAVAGRLDSARGGPAVDLTTTPFATRRSVYGFIDRQNLPGVFRTFDLASPDASSPQRHHTTVPQQALFLMNSPFVVEQAKHLAARPDLTALPTAARIDRLYHVLYGRPPEPEEVAMGLQFLDAAQASGDGPALGPWEQYAQVLMLANEFAFVD